jgi:hypothetical protein
MSLEQWLRNAWLQRRDPTLPEIHKLLQVVDRELSDARAEGISADGRFEHAYTAILQLCIVPLRAAGYQVPKGESRHKRAIDSLRYTLGEPWGETADYIELCSRQRGQAMYERIDVVSDADADELLSKARQLREDVVRWLTANHADLVPPAV